MEALFPVLVKRSLRGRHSQVELGNEVEQEITTHCIPVLQSRMQNLLCILFGMGILQSRHNQVKAKLVHQRV
ncbi:Uncharacterised protein [Candidatus Venteria ishoeyi]|uniref:Uncharacterized protein n=1 Tax=Candidatus Venteria ishoeyi TaxID=1899563 RepID=A0A1H6FDV5_9GAMM|nr:Uncharacterised protein [Candidatus Venteria ishoeyi]